MGIRNNTTPQLAGQARTKCKLTKILVKRQQDTLFLHRPLDHLGSRAPGIVSPTQTTS